MSDTRLRDRLLDLAEDAPKSFDMPPTLVHRARQRFVRTVASATTIIVILVAGGTVGVRALGTSRRHPVIQPTETPTPTPAFLPGSGGLEAGPYLLYVDSLKITLTVPRDWEAWDLGVLRRGGKAPKGSGLTFWIVSNVVVDPCHYEEGVLEPPVGPTVDDLATALAKQARRQATTPTVVTLDGYAGKHLQLTVPPHIKLATCSGGKFFSWTKRDGGARWQQGPGQRDELWILDVHGIRLVIDAAFFPKTPAKERAELDRILESVRIERTPPQP
jgi:hypothetical protein